MKVKEEELTEAKKLLIPIRRLLSANPKGLGCFAISVRLHTTEHNVQNAVFYETDIAEDENGKLILVHL